MNMPLPASMLSQFDTPSSSILEKTTRTAIRHRIGGDNPRKAYLERFESGIDDVNVVHIPEGDSWLKLDSSRDQEFLCKLFKVATQVDNYKEGDGWFRSNEDDNDEISWISLDLIDEIGPGIINDMCALEKVATKEFFQFLVKRFSKRVKEAEGLAWHSITFANRLRQSPTDFVHFTKGRDEAQYGAYKVTDYDIADRGLVLSVYAYVFKGGERYDRVRGTLVTSDVSGIRFVRKPERYTDVYRAISKMDVTDNGQIIGRIKGVYKKVLVDLDDEKEIARQKSKSGGGGMMAIMMGIGGGSSTPTMESYQNQVAVMDPDLLRDEASDVYNELIPFDVAGVTKDVEITEDDKASVLNQGIWFGLENKGWFGGGIICAEPVQYDPSIMDRVIMDPIRKQALLALVETPALDLDMIENKGLNTTFLLSGDPGTGKTLTAEAISHRLSRPLFKISFGDLGTSIREMESRCRRYLSYANRWGAVVLLDEADVFLEKRDNFNLERTAMVASFLSLLEYYQGVLFLTTNRTSTIDPAIHSRMSLTLSFSRSDLDGKALWIDLLEKVGLDQVPEEALVKLDALDLNGREIKNLLSTASRIAVHQNRTLDIDLVLEVRKLYS